MDKLLLTTDEAAKLLGISRSTMSHLLYTGTVKSLKIGSLRRVPLQALHEYINTSQDSVA